jgi:hypothetical protein
MPKPEGVKVFAAADCIKNIAATLYKCAEPTFSKQHIERNRQERKKPLQAMALELYLLYLFTDV